MRSTQVPVAVCYLSKQGLGVKLYEFILCVVCASGLSVVLTLT